MNKIYDYDARLSIIEHRLCVVIVVSVVSIVVEPRADAPDIQILRN